MIEQHNNQLILTFPTADSATIFAAFLASLLQPSLPAPEISGPPSAPSPVPTQDSPEQRRSRHTVLTPERQDALAAQRAQGLTERQRLLRAQTTLRDGVLPFSRPTDQPPLPSSQPSPRMRAQAEGGFADGSGERPARPLPGEVPSKPPAPVGAKKLRRS